MSFNVTENVTTLASPGTDAFHDPSTNTLSIAIVSVLTFVVCAYACAYVCVHTCCSRKKSSTI